MRHPLNILDSLLMLITILPPPVCHSPIPLIHLILTPFLFRSTGRPGFAETKQGHRRPKAESTRVSMGRPLSASTMRFRFLACAAHTAQGSCARLPGFFLAAFDNSLDRAPDAITHKALRGRPLDSSLSPRAVCIAPSGDISGDA